MDSNRPDDRFPREVPALPYTIGGRWDASHPDENGGAEEHADADADADADAGDVSRWETLSLLHGAAYTTPDPGDAHPGDGAIDDRAIDDAPPAVPAQPIYAGSPDLAFNDAAPTLALPSPAPPRGAPPAERPLLEVRDITVTYGQIAAVRNLSLTVGHGEVVALLGANGAGKTTTLRAISGLLRPRSGEIVFDGQRIVRRSPEQIARLGLAHLPEGRGMFPRLSVAENLRMAAYGAGISPQEYAKRLAGAVELFPVLGERMGQLAGTLSGGQQQMLAVGRALLTAPRLLMIDELSFGLAPGVVKQLFALLPRIAAAGTAILLVEQFVGNALAVANRAYVLETGELTFAGPAAELIAREGFVESSYLGAGARRLDYERIRPAETEMLRVRVDPALVRRLRAVAGGETLPRVANEALQRYVAAREAQAEAAGSADDEERTGGTR